MDTYEATKVVMSRIQSLDPENASKIMGYILIQDQGEKEIIRLAFVPESLLQSYINQAKARLGIASNNPFPKSLPRISIPNNGFHLSNPSSPGFQRASPRPFSYAAALNGGGIDGPVNTSGSSSLQFHGGSDQLPFLDDSVVDPLMSPTEMNDSLVFPYGGDDSCSVQSPSRFHRRSCSVNDSAFLSHLEEGGGFGWRPCMYFARGFCKNGSACKFLHGDSGGGEAIDVGSPSNNHGFDEMLRMKAVQQQRLALMASRGQQNPFGYNKCMDFLNENLRSDFSLIGGGVSSSSRQIYLTFPADSTFKEEDVSNYFRMFGPVQDVRIPYQQKRMFGFVTFAFPETVKLILAKGNPHFVCDSRVLVKPYKEKGKIPEKKTQQRQHLDVSPSGIDLPLGPRMLFSSQETMLRRKLEQEAELQHAIELQSRRMMNLQLMDLKHQHNNHLLQSFRAGSLISSPRQSELLMNQNFVSASDGISLDDSEEFEATKSPALASDLKLVVEGTESSRNNNGAGNKKQNVNDDLGFPDSLEHVLPDNLFASPRKSTAAEHRSFFAQASADDSIAIATTSSNNNTPAMPGSSPIGMPSLKSCYIQMPKFSSGQEVIEM